MSGDVYVVVAVSTLLEILVGENCGGWLRRGGVSTLLEILADTVDFM